MICFDGITDVSSIVDEFCKNFDKTTEDFLLIEFRFLIRKNRGTIYFKNYVPLFVPLGINTK